MLDEWAKTWGIPDVAVDDLRRRMVETKFTERSPYLLSEGDASNAVRIKATRAGLRLWRNNVGAGKLDNGQFVRWGLANESQTMNASIKSADLIGVRPIRITLHHVGMTIGQFVSREVKAPGWKYSGNGREAAQLRWIEVLTSLGADAAFTTGEL